MCFDATRRESLASFTFLTASMLNFWPFRTLKTSPMCDVQVNFLRVSREPANEVSSNSTQLRYLVHKTAREFGVTVL